MHNREELINRLRLLRTKNIGALTYRYLMYKWKTSANAMKAIELTHSILSIENAIKEIDDTYNAGGNFLLHDDINYPSILNTYNAMPIIIYKGNIDLLKKTLIGIVGTRQPSAHGIQFCSYISKKLIEKDIAIVSGTAIGIDTIAHTTSLKNTIGILPSGLKHLNHSNINLCHEISKYGLLITDQSFNMPPAVYQFPQRNRLIASLCHSLIVIEAPKNSGALITANYTLDLKKNVYIMPGRPFDNKTEGSNLFLQLWMKNNYVNILFNENINIHTTNVQESLTILFENNYDIKYEKLILNLLNETPISIADLHKLVSINISTLLTTLSYLEMKGNIVIYNHTIYLQVNI